MLALSKILHSDKKKFTMEPCRNDGPPIMRIFNESNRIYFDLSVERVLNWDNAKEWKALVDNKLKNIKNIKNIENVNQLRRSSGSFDIPPSTNGKVVIY